MRSVYSSFLLGVSGTIGVFLSLLRSTLWTVEFSFPDSSSDYVAGKERVPASHFSDFNAQNGAGLIKAPHFEQVGSPGQIKPLSNRGPQTRSRNPRERKAGSGTGSAVFWFSLNESNSYFPAAAERVSAHTGKELTPLLDRLGLLFFTSCACAGHASVGKRTKNHFDLDFSIPDDYGSSGLLGAGDLCSDWRNAKSSFAKL
jgi:hypothetical protein